MQPGVCAGASETHRRQENMHEVRQRKEVMTMIQWEVIKKDLQKGWQEGIVAVKEGMVVVKKKTGEMTEEGRKQYKILSLKAIIQRSIHDLGKRVYTLMAVPKTAKGVFADDKVKSIVVQIKKYERQIAELEGRPRVKAASKKKR
jgi:hypothetical protein